ncbi:DMT family transporter [Neobacillus niacini]|uniref:DMT family transporter n=1 Tax=Neobacillus niacini TaxID=86668 RepID=UPI002860DF9D|nr:DMT family transporter [Neobacillus niacini]MDR7001837.1 drug/metabolite transporter (DMT)-like permease [Neobacillus niacini]
MPIFYVLILLLTSFLWGGNFVFGKFLVGHASPMTITTLRWLIAILVLLPIVLKQEKKLIPPKTSLIPLLFMGLTGVVFFNLFQFLALEKTTATNVGLISTLNPISISIFSALLLKEKLKTLQIFSMGVSFLGVLMVLSKGEISHLFSLHFNIGDLWMVAAVIIWGLYSICSKWVMKKMPPILATFYSGVFGVVILIPFNLSSFQISNFNSSFLWAILYTGVISTVVCMVLWNIGVLKVGATNSGIFLNFNPIFTSILAFFFLGERMTWTELVGSIIVISGCFLFSWFGSSKNRRRRRKSTKANLKFGA